MRRYGGLPVLLAALATASGLATATADETTRPASADAKPPVALPPIIISRETTYITEPLTPEGLPDYAAWLNQKYGAGVTPENNAAVLLAGLMRHPLPGETLVRMGLDPTRSLVRPRWLGRPYRWRDSLRRLRKILEARMASAESRPPGLDAVPEDLGRAFNRQWEPARSSPWVETGHPLIAVWLDANADAIELVAEATRRSRYWVPVRTELTETTFGPSSSLQVASALRMRALLRAGHGDAAGAAEDLLTGARLGRLLRQGPCTMQQILGLGVLGEVLEAVPAVVAAGTAEPEGPRRLLEGFRQLAPGPRPTETLSVFERVFQLDNVLRLRSAAAKGRMAERLRHLVGENGRLPEAAFRIPLAAIDWNEMLRATNRAAEGDETLDEYEDGDAWSAVVEPLVERAGTDPQARRQLARAFLVVPVRTRDGSWFSAFATLTRPERLQGQWDATQARYRLALAATAATLHRVRSGTYPRGAAALGKLLEEPAAAQGERDGYTTSYHVAADGARFALTAIPTLPGESRWGAFCVDDSGRPILRYDGSDTPSLEAGRCSDPESAPAAGITLQTRRVLAAAPAAVGIVAALAGLVSFARHRKGAPLGWRRPLGALTLLGLLGLTSLLISLRVVNRALSPPALLAAAVGSSLLAGMLAACVWRGARWAWRILVLLCPTVVVALLAILFARGAAWPLPALLGLVVGLVGVPLFVLATLIHHDVASDFGSERGRAPESEAPPPRDPEDPSASVRWGRTIVVFTFVTGLSVACFFSALLLPLGWDAIATPALIFLWLAVIAALVVPPARFTPSWKEILAIWVTLVGGLGAATMIIETWSVTRVFGSPGAWGAGAGLVALFLFVALFALLLGVNVASKLPRRASAGRLASRLRRHVVPGSVVVAVAVLFVWGMQRDWYLTKRRRLVARTEALRRDIRQAEVVVSRLEQFQREVRTLDVKLESMERIVPPAAGEALFRETLGRLASEMGLVVESATSDRWQSDFYETIEVELRLRGRHEDIDRLAARVERLPRLVVWHTLHLEPTGAIATVTIYALRQSAPAERRRSSQAAPREGPVWLWPYAPELRRRRDELNRLHARIRELEPLRREIDRLEEGRERLQHLKSLVDRLRREQTTAGASLLRSE